MKPKEPVTEFAVLGLGRFGQSIVKTLAEYDVHILAVDRNADRLHEVTDYATRAVQADVSDEAAMERLGIGAFDVVMLTMGEDFEASVLATMTAKEKGAKMVVVKAYGLRQKKILESVGADRVILPEVEMGSKIARQLVRPNILDVLGDTGRFQITEMHPPAEWVGKSVRQLDLRHARGLNVLALIRGSEHLIPVPPDLALAEADVLVTLCDQQAADFIEGL